MNYVCPPVSMLARGEVFAGEDPQVIARAKERLQDTLKDFDVDGAVTGHVAGPQVTRYEISLGPGVPAARVSTLANNILMNLEAQSIRILAPVPGKNVIGVEVPNTKRETVALRGIFESDEWRDHKGEIPVVLGKNVSGNPVVIDLAKAPHLLIAGATGSGKSACVNSLLMSLIFKFKPDELRLILIDPKMVEFTSYQALPFLLTPVINEADKALQALRWTVHEMEKRYRMLAQARTRNIREYNERSPQPEKLPFLVIVADEFADLMTGDRAIRKDVEAAIAQIAQKGRAAGIHLVLATQRPSRDVLSNVIKANLPAKIALRVGSMIDSRVILDSVGAEGLLGYGDMLFLPPSSPILERIQGAWVSNEEVEKIAEFVSKQVQPNFNTDVVPGLDDCNGIAGAMNNENGNGKREIMTQKTTGSTRISFDRDQLNRLLELLLPPEERLTVMELSPENGIKIQTTALNVWLALVPQVVSPEKLLITVKDAGSETSWFKPLVALANRFSAKIPETLVEKSGGLLKLEPGNAVSFEVATLRDRFPLLPDFELRSAGCGDDCLNLEISLKPRP